MGKTKEKASLIVPEKLASNQAIFVLMDELRRLKDIGEVMKNFKGEVDKKLVKQIAEVEIALELMIIYFDR